MLIDQSFDKSANTDYMKYKTINHHDQDYAENIASINKRIIEDG